MYKLVGLVLGSSLQIRFNTAVKHVLVAMPVSVLHPRNDVSVNGVPRVKGTKTKCVLQEILRNRLGGGTIDKTLILKEGLSSYREPGFIIYTITCRLYGTIFTFCSSILTIASLSS